jgi:hypothetical protein
MNRLDVKSIIARFGGRMELWRRLCAEGHSISVKAIEKWSERGSIPSAKLIWLIKLAEREGKPINLIDHLTHTEK